jgi:hypothetical protein
VASKTNIAITMNVYGRRNARATTERAVSFVPYDKLMESGARAERADR